MSDTPDLQQLLADWPYDPANDVRVVRAADGREIMQVRLPLGIEQFELEGRPDGHRPHEMESFFDFQRERLAKAKVAGKEETFTLGADECVDLFNEGVLYYYRYLHLFQIEDWPRTARDTERNLRLFDFVHRHAQREEDRVYLEQWRPYIVRIHAAATAMLELEQGHHQQALHILRAAHDTIEALPDLDEETFKTERQRSLAALREMAGQIEKNQPLTERQRLERQMQQAVAAEEFERAAELRDRLRALRQTDPSPNP